MRFKPNLCTLDRVFRFSLGVVCIYLGFLDGSLIPNKLVAGIIGVFGIVNVVASFASYCPVYAACGFSTRRSTLDDTNNELTH